MSVVRSRGNVGGVVSSVVECHDACVRSMKQVALLKAAVVIVISSASRVGSSIRYAD